MTFATYQVLKTSELPETIDSVYSIIPISRNDGKKGKSGLCMIVDSLSTNALQTIVLNTPAGLEWLSNEVAKIRGKIASSLKVVDRDSINITAIVNALTAEINSQRISKESIGEWFDSDLASLIGDKIRTNIPTASNDKVEKLVSGYRNAFILLAGRDVSMEAKLKEQLQRAILLLPDDYESVLGNKIINKLENVGSSSDILDAL